MTILGPLLAISEHALQLSSVNALKLGLKGIACCLQSLRQASPSYPLLA